jgi:YVTN family beta-propeller protein
VDLGTPAGWQAQVKGQQHLVELRISTIRSLLAALVLAFALVLAVLPPGEATAGWGITVGVGPKAVAFDSDTGYAYVVSGDRTLTTIRTTPSYSVINTASLAQNPTDVTVSSAYDKVYVALPGAQQVVVADLGGNLVGQINTGKKTKPTFLAVDDARGLLYVANQQEKRIAIVDMATDTILERQAANVSADGFGFHPGLNRLYVSDNQTKTVRSFDPDTATQTGVVTLAGAVTALFVDVERNKVYAALPTLSQFAVLDAATLSVEGYYPTPTAPAAFAVDYSNDRLLVSYSGSSQVGIWDAVTLSELSRASVGPSPAGIAVMVGRQLALVANSGSNTVTIIDTASGKSVGVVSTLERPSSVLVSQATNRIYVGHYQIDSSDPVSLNAPLEIFSLSTGDAVGSIGGIGNVFPWGLAEKPASSRLYVSRTYAGTVAVIDTSSNTLLSEIPVSAMPRGLLFDSATGYLFVSGMFTSDLVVVNTATNSVINRVPVGSESAGLALDSAAGLVYVAVESTGEVRAVRASTGEVVATASLGGKPLGVSYSPSSNRVYVANYELGELQVIDAATMTQVDSVTFGSPVHTVRTGGGRVSVASWEGGANFVLDEATMSLIQRADYESPIDFTLDPSAGYLYQLSFGSAMLVRAGLP